MDACGINVIRVCCAMGDMIHIINGGVEVGGLCDIGMSVIILFLCPFNFFNFVFSVYYPNNCV